MEIQLKILFEGLKSSVGEAISPQTPEPEGSYYIITNSKYYILTNAAMQPDKQKMKQKIIIKNLSSSKDKQGQKHTEPEAKKPHQTPLTEF